MHGRMLSNLPIHICKEGGRSREERRGQTTANERESGGEAGRRHCSESFLAIVSTPFNWAFSPELLGTCCGRSVGGGRLAACYLLATGGPFVFQVVGFAITSRKSAAVFLRPPLGN